MPERAFPESPVGKAPCDLPPVEQTQYAALLAVQAAAHDQPDALDELLEAREVYVARGHALHALATKYAGQAAQANQAAEEIRTAVFAALRDLQLASVATSTGIVKRVANGGNQAVAITGVVPPDYLKTTTTPDRTKIGAELREGAIFDWACLEPRGEHLEVTIQ